MALNYYEMTESDKSAVFHDDRVSHIDSNGNIVFLASIENKNFDGKVKYENGNVFYFEHGKWVEMTRPEPPLKTNRFRRGIDTQEYFTSAEKVERIIIRDAKRNSK